MAEIAFVALTLAFFALCVETCVAWTGSSGGSGDRGYRGGADSMSVDEVVGPVLAVLLAGFLVAALLFPGVT